MSESTLPGRPVVSEPSFGSARKLLQRLGALLSARTMVPFWLGVILVLGAFFRFTGVDWDEGHHLHPDERFLSTVLSDTQWPEENFLRTYFDEANSKLNPRNVGKTFFVYGDFPIVFTKGVTVALDNWMPRADGQSWQGYGHNYRVGRVIDALMDIGTMLALFLLGRRLYRDARIALLGTLLYAGMALAIQQAHFFVVDPFTTFFVTVALYFMVRVFQEGRLLDYVLAGTFVGISLATKLSVYSLALVMVAVAGYRFYVESKDRGSEAALERVTVRLVLSGVAALVMVRIFQPYAFSGLFEIAPRWWANAQEARAWVSGERDAPFAHQWTDRTMLWFPWKNMVLWGMGLPLGLAAWTGWAAALGQIVRRQKWIHLVPVVWIGVLFLHMGTQWVKSMRYFLPIYPTLALMAAWFLIWLWDRAQPTQAEVLSNRGLFAWTRVKAGLLIGVITVATLIYAYGFTSIYTRPHTRVAASAWIYENVPPGSVVANETVWDDGLPLRLAEYPDPGQLFQTRILPPTVDPATLPEAERQALLVDTTLNITDEDDPGKWYGRPDEMGNIQPGILDKLDQIEYYFISSNRQYDSMKRLPMRFPAVINFYDALFSGRLGFEKVAEFTSYPHFLGIPLPDQGAEEAWHVYDHNRVQVWRKTDAYSREKAEALILGDVEWDEIRQLWPRDVAGWKGNLKLTAAEQAVYERSGTWSQLFDRSSLQNRMPVIAWALLLELLGLMAIPYLLVVGRGLPERGYTFAKALGLLLVGWLIWMLASLKLVTFTVGGILLAMGIVGAGSVLLTLRARRGRSLPTLLQTWWQRDGRIFLIAQAVFWGFFLLVLAIRWANPDIWHPDMGGERPMDFAYLNAVIKSPYFPPMDPWFAGGYINYYYFGFVLVATLIKLTGIVPAIAYNLALPTLFAMLAAGVWGAALALLVPLRRRLTDDTSRSPLPAPRSPDFTFATLAALFVAVIGNLGELQVLTSGLTQLSTLNFRSGIPGLETMVKSLDGLIRGMIIGGQMLPGRMEWPYWNATRIIPETINELPWFTFLYADLHAHLMALPFTVLAIGLALAFVRAPLGEGWLAEALRLGLLALVIGALWPINTWDFPTYALVAFAGLGLREWRREGAITLRAMFAVMWRWVLVLLLGRLLFQPFHANYGAAYSSIERWRGARTGMADFLIVHGFFLFTIFFALVSDFLYGHGHNGAVRLIRFRLRRLLNRPAATLAERVVHPSLGTQLALSGTVMSVIAALALLLLGWGASGLSLFLLTLALLLFFRRRPQPLWQMALFFIILGLGLTLAVEVIVLRGDIGRMNTVFKFYLQVWVLWGIATAIGAALISRHLPRWMPEWRTVWRFGFVLLFGVTLLYPVFATYAKINDRFDRSVGATLNGAAFMEKAILYDRDQTMELRGDADAIRWMQEEVPGSPTVAEMQTYDRLYGWGNRYAMWTGNPAIIGWHWHQQQQRAAANADEVMERVNDVQQNIYNTPNAATAYATLLQYDTEYIVVGPMERAYSVPEGIDKFEMNRGRYWDLVYENPEVKIYRVIE
ncbi:MAG: DUF2298 domain-containing protein [Chloroflexota bacterium]|nr:DUF2298 domain-containing protein [Chloroflexota bacterium]